MYKKLEAGMGHFERLGTSGVGPTIGTQVSTNAANSVIDSSRSTVNLHNIRFSNNFFMDWL
jgi:hypothetical protein